MAHPTHCGHVNRDVKPGGDSKEVVLICENTKTGYFGQVIPNAAPFFSTEHQKYTEYRAITECRIN